MKIDFLLNFLFKQLGGKLKQVDSAQTNLFRLL